MHAMYQSFKIVKISRDSEHFDIMMIAAIIIVREWMWMRMRMWLSMYHIFVLFFLLCFGVALSHSLQKELNNNMVEHISIAT